MASDAQESDDSGIVLPGGVRIPPALLRFRFVRSSGPGGQNVNKVSSKAVLSVPVEALAEAIGPAATTRLRRIAANRIDGDDELSITCDEHRSQHRNRGECVERLRGLLVRAMVKPKRRRPTKPSRAAVERRLKAKRHRSAVKRMRGERPE